MVDPPASGEQVQPEPARYCPNCGSANAVHAQFCASCGASLTGISAPAVATAVAPPVARACPSCGREWGSGIACQFCDQVEGLPPGIKLSSSAKRLGSHVLDLVIVILTLFIGWLIWQLIVAKDGQSPAKQLLGMRVIKLRTMTKATWGTMFLREVILKTLIEIIAVLTFGLRLLLYCWLLWDKNRQELWDKAINTVVVDDPGHVLA